MSKPYTLPLTRKDLFKNAYRMDLFTLLKISMLIAMFFIPLIVYFTANG